VSKYPEITPALLDELTAEDDAVMDAARGSEDAQAWLARFYAARSAAATNLEDRKSGLVLALVFAGLATVHGRVDSVKLYRDLLAKHRTLSNHPEHALAYRGDLIADLDAVVADKAPDERVAARI